MSSVTVQDTPYRYGLVSRGLHWGMALLFVWQFTSAALQLFVEATPLESFFWPTHRLRRVHPVGARISVRRLGPGQPARSSRS